MQINTNTTGMNTELSVATDKLGRDHCVTVVKGTFDVQTDGTTTLAEKQQPLVFADEHYGDPGNTPIKYECDFAHTKPRCDVLLNGSAHAPNGRPAKKVHVALSVGSMNKSFDVVGNRFWDHIALSITPSEPLSFFKLPITYGRAYGGVDTDPDKPDKQDTYKHNPVGVGHYPLTKKSDLPGKPLPNTAQTLRPINTHIGRYRPMSFGTIGRNFPARVAHAGTYDQNWLDNICPFLPDDFNPLYFQSAPPDQQVEHLQGGEVVSCTNLTPDPQGKWGFTVPRVEIPIKFRFRDRDVTGQPKLDTLIIEPDERRFILVWRASTPLGNKLNALREIVVGHPTKTRPPRPQRKFKSLAAYIEWKKKVRGPLTTKEHDR